MKRYWPTLVLAVCGVFCATAQSALETARRDFLNPPVDCRPHTRWWWMGNALSKADITWQLDQMAEQGIGGVEQITMEKVYERGNHAYLSGEYFDLLRHAVKEAKARHMEFALNFGGPGWIWGGDFVAEQDRCRNLMSSFVDLDGGRMFDGELSTKATINPLDVPRSRPTIWPGDKLVAVVAGRIEEGRLRESSLIVLTSRMEGRRLRWRVPTGKWRVAGFWLTPCSTGPVVDHLSKGAMERYCDYLGGKLRAAVGDEFGKTVESMFSDSFEVPVNRNGIYWNASLLEAFRARKGYDLTRYLPALWWEVDGISGRIRYDVNEFLHQTGMEGFFGPFLGWCERNGVAGRIQPYGFVTDNIEGAGRAHIPEMEITAGEKDAVPWFDMRIGPRAYVASGAHLYGRNVVTTEAYTYLHWGPGRETLEELKIATDIYFRSGSNKIYNHGFTASPERDFAPTRRFGAEMVISPANVWWPYYRHLSDYVARCSAVLRHGTPVADIAVYSPLANQWTMNVFNAPRWTRDFDWGSLAKLILTNGYDFDLLNDDVLVNRSDISSGAIRVRDLTYRVLVLPNVRALPLASMKRIEEYVRNGGIAIALERVPSEATGLNGYRQNDADVQAIVAKMFRKPANVDDLAEQAYGNGHTYNLISVLTRTNPLDFRSTMLDPFVNTLRKYVEPDFGIDFVRERLRENNGLLYAHRRMPQADVYFVANVQDRAVDSRVAFRVAGGVPELWDPVSGSVHALYEYEHRGRGTVVPLKLGPWETAILVFRTGTDATRQHVDASGFADVVRVDESGLEALAGTNGVHSVVRDGGRVVRQPVDGIPSAYEVSGDWRVVLESEHFPRREFTVAQLTSWTGDAATRNFSGTGRYTITFDLPAAFVAPDLQLRLSLGDVGDIGGVTLNGVKVGVVWVHGQTLEVTKAAKVGANTLEIAVTNRLINRFAALSSAPPVPPDLAQIYGQGLNDKRGFSREVFGFKPLPASGLLGPVRIVALKRVRLRGY
jgi:hypothetical protein